MKGTERSLWFLSVALGLTSLVTDSITFANPRTSNMAEEDVKQLIVMVDATLAGQERIGSGIIFGFGPDQVYIVTADHVVRQAAREADEVTIRLYWSPDKKIKAKLLSHRDTAMDVAVLSVSDLTGLKTKGDELPFDRMGDPSSLQRGDAIYLLGNPHGKSWRVNTAPEKFIETRGDSLEFESNLVAPGHSGGALLNGERELLGMLRSDQAPYGEAVSIIKVVKRLKDWGYPVRLHQVGIQVGSGWDRTCMVSPDGVARCWGYDLSGGPSIETIQGARLKSISVGSYQVCGIILRGAAYCLGSNGYGQLGNGTKTDSYTSAQRVQGGLTFVSLSAGQGHTCGVTTDFSVYCWGMGENGQLGNNSRENSFVPVKVSSVELAFESVSAGWLYTCALTTSGTLYCWGGLGGNLNFGSGVPVDASDGLKFKSISAGMNHLCGVTPEGSAYCAGSNEFGELGNGSDVPGSDKFVAVKGQLTFKSVSASIGGFTCGLTITKAVYCWGLNNFGQLGNGSTKNSDIPVAVSGGLKFASISKGNVHACGVTIDDAIYCWGSNISGAIGPGSPKESSVPFKVMPN
jgi:hypothetical protein